jgi:hypothetical protein
MIMICHTFFNNPSILHLSHISVFGIILRVICNCFFNSHSLAGLSNEEATWYLWGTNWICLNHLQEQQQTSYHVKYLGAIFDGNIKYRILAEAI